jgi:hypothetical protein
LILTTKFKIMGESMSDFVWYWTEGSSKIYTKNIELAEKAMKEGILIMGFKSNPNII